MEPPFLDGDLADANFLEAGPLLTPGLSPVCCFLVEPLPVFKPFPAVVVVLAAVAVLLLLLLLLLALLLLILDLPAPLVLLMVSFKPSWLGFTIYSVELNCCVDSARPPLFDSLLPMSGGECWSGADAGAPGSACVAVAVVDATDIVDAVELTAPLTTLRIAATCDAATAAAFISMPPGAPLPLNSCPTPPLTPPAPPPLILFTPL